MDPKNPPPKRIREEIERRLFGAVGARWAPIGGGLSGDPLWRVALEELAFAVRAWPESHDLGLANQIREAVSRAGVRFAREPRLLLREAPLAWEATEWITGVPLSETPDDPAAQQAAITALAAFHRVALRFQPPVAEPSPAWLKRRRLLHELVHGVSLPAANEAWGPELVELRRRLPAAAAAALARFGEPRPLSNRRGVHGDARPEHFLLHEGKISGLIDWGAVTQDTPLLDAARLVGELACGNSPTFERLLDSYEQAVEQSVDRPLVRLLDASGAVLAAANWLRWLSEPDFSPRDPRLIRGRIRSILARLP